MRLRIYDFIGWNYNFIMLKMILDIRMYIFDWFLLFTSGLHWLGIPAKPGMVPVALAALWDQI